MTSPSHDQRSTRAAPLPEAQEESTVPATEEERLRALIGDGLQSGDPIPLDEAFFERLKSRLPKTE